ncbi:MAG TPA: YiiX/YebB-like N1pC/P60 family cysteine hydrolase, partial [Chroococcales cyanobacterium]
MTNRIDQSRSPVSLPKAAPAKQEKIETRTNVAQDELALSKSTPKTEGLNEEELSFLKAGLLPNNYSDLKACLQKEGRDAAIELARKGKQGPFSANYGDPVLMLETAKRAEKNPELMRLFKDIRKGDILVSTWNHNDNIISNLTKGPFVHSILCSADGPPPEFIEAIGMTAGSNDKNADQVRRMSLGETLYDSLSIRMVRPTEGLPAAKSKEVVDRAVLYAEKQLGKPYDYAFTNDNKGTGLSDAYYCSELTFLAYSAPEGGNFKLSLNKSSERDQMLVELEKGIESLKPKDQAAM